MTDVPVVRGASIPDPGDQFAGEAARMLAFLDTPPVMPGGSPEVLRGEMRIFDPEARSLANQAAAAAGSEAAAAVPNVPAARPMTEPGALLAMDLDALTVEQLVQLMTACASQMMQRMASMSTQAREHS